MMGTIETLNSKNWHTTKTIHHEFSDLIAENVTGHISLKIIK